MLTIDHVQKTTEFKTRERAKAALEVLSWLEAGAPHKLNGFDGEFTFAMEDFIAGPETTAEYETRKNAPPRCGTACCIGGAIELVERNGEIDGEYFGNLSGLCETFGLRMPDEYQKTSAKRELYRLFMAEHPDLPQNEHGRRQLSLETITPRRAAMVLRHYLETGVADWRLGA